MKSLALSFVAAVLCFAGVGCAAKGSIRTGHNAGAGAAVRVGYTTVATHAAVPAGCCGDAACCPGARRAAPARK